MEEKVTVRIYVDGGNLCVEKSDKSDFTDEENKVIKETLEKTMNGIMFHIMDAPTKFHMLEEAVGKALEELGHEIEVKESEEE